MRRVRKLEDEGLRKFSIGEEVFSKDNTQQKMTVVSYSGKCCSCAIEKDNTQKEILFFEDDLISEWQIPFY